MKDIPKRRNIRNAGRNSTQSLTPSLPREGEI